jgi:hypothetical protein
VLSAFELKLSSFASAGSDCFAATLREICDLTEVLARKPVLFVRVLMGKGVPDVSVVIAPSTAGHALALLIHATLLARPRL